MCAVVESVVKLACDAGFGMVILAAQRTQNGGVSGGVALMVKRVLTTKQWIGLEHDVWPGRV
eukprot:573004-Prorocentrum_lima.AAC.1